MLPGDVASLKPGDDFNDLKPGYVIFICTFDPFGKGLYRYTFEERCRECDMGLGDETCKIFLSTKGRNEKDVSAELIHFLKYMEKSTDECAAESVDDAIVRLHKKVCELKNWRDLEARYMTFEELMKQRESKGRMEGRAESVLELLEECGTIEEETREKVLAQKDGETLKRWVKLAARVSSVEEFIAGM